MTSDSEAQSEAPSVDSLRNELREGSETRFMGTRSTPDGKETVEMIPIEWAAEVIQAREAKINRLIVEARIEELEHLKEEPLFKRKVVDTEDLRRRTGYVRCRVRVKGLIDSRIAALSNNLSKGGGK